MVTVGTAIKPLISFPRVMKELYITMAPIW